MSSDSFQKRKDDLEKKLVTIIIDAYKNEEIDYFTMKHAAKYILDTIDHAKTQQNLMFILRELTKKSPVFKNSLVINSEEDVKVREKQVIDRLSKYIKNFPAN